jgi:hypothetical protein
MAADFVLKTVSGPEGRFIWFLVKQVKRKMTNKEVKVCSSILQTRDYKSQLPGDQYLDVIQGHF